MYTKVQIVSNHILQFYSCEEADFVTVICNARNNEFVSKSRLLYRTKCTVRPGTVVGGAVYFSSHFEGPTDRLKLGGGRDPPVGIENMYTQVACWMLHRS